MLKLEYAQSGYPRHVAYCFVVANLALTCRDLQKPCPILRLRLGENWDVKRSAHSACWCWGALGRYWVFSRLLALGLAEASKGGVSASPQSRGGQPGVLYCVVSGVRWRVFPGF